MTARLILSAQTSAHTKNNCIHNCYKCSEYVIKANSILNYICCLLNNNFERFIFYLQPLLWAGF